MNETPQPGTLAQVVRTLQLVWRLLNDPRVPAMVKLIIPGVILYVLSPIDLIPDVLIGVGQLDDIAIIFFGVRFFIEMCPPDVVMEHRRAIEASGRNARGEYVDANYRVHDDDARRK